MKTKHLLFSLILLLTIFLAACSPKTGLPEVMSEKNVVSDTTSEPMTEDVDDMKTGKEDEMMSGDTMMEDKDEGVMAGDKDDGMMAEKEGEMDDHSDNGMIDDNDSDGMAGDKNDEMMIDEEDGMGAHNGDGMMDDKDDGAMMDDEKDDMSEDAMMMVPDWFKVTLTDVNTGETFMLTDHKGKVVLVETLAMWCSNCLKQQKQVQALHDLVGEPNDFVSLGIDIDPNEDANALKAYTEKNGFDWMYTVAPVEVAREIGERYGDQYLNPPSTPMLIIDREGEVHLLPFGIKSAENLLEALQPFLDSEM